MPIRIVHVITGLNVGGAERMLLGLAGAGPEAGFDSVVICLGPRGPISDLLEAQNVAVHHLNLRSIWLFPFNLGRLVKLVRAAQPDLVQGWMYHGNLAAYFAGRKIGVPIVWNIRQSLHRMDLFKLTTRLAIRINAWCSTRVDSVLYNSKVARHQHEAIGFMQRNGARIPNGIDLERFSGKQPHRDVLRTQVGIARDDKVVIAVGRVHPIKGHAVLMRSMRPVIEAEPNVRLIVVGRGSDWDKEPFSEYQTKTLVRDHVMLMGERSDVVELLSVADVFVSASETEGFPNAVAEAMAASLPSVVTDVGDCALLVDDCGVVVSPGDPDALAAGILQILHSPADDLLALGARARARVENEFSLSRITRQYADHYRQLIAAGQSKA